MKDENDRQQRKKSLFQSILTTSVKFPTLSSLSIVDPPESGTRSTSKKSQKVSSGYLLAAAVSALFGGVSLSTSFIALLLFTETMEAPPFFAAVGAGMFTIFTQMLSANFTLLTDPSSLSHAGDFMTSLFLFSMVIGLTEGAKSAENWEGEMELEDDGVDEGSNVLGARQNRNSMGPSKQQPSSDPITDDLRQWDEKLFTRQRMKQDTDDDRN
eukprot:CAMPEP_0184695518 /NCGR_PEP_ID=MMETSP0313-20130426/3124_1 /TAXON_ID=2792 /ORGANISM="Porphyridium aerugineum, Strain SAG 1380-2" /LENGTH=212 /DNA_ID=CAMNT_0027153991 /DNA_START=22 /DNA_END=660 /DNA_ORIENTATION=-